VKFDFEIFGRKEPFVLCDQVRGPSVISGSVQYVHAASLQKPNPFYRLAPQGSSLKVVGLRADRG
jgi:hypothetical protein